MSPVVEVLRELSPRLPDVMVVGAACRDFLHALGGHRSSGLRSTSDLDIALAVSGWDHYDAIVRALRPVGGGTSRIRFRVADVAVDIIPFGRPVEAPDGVVTPAGRAASPMSVFGFQDVWSAARPVQLTSTTSVRVPTVPGYTVLKLKAWADRSQDGQYKDGYDLATAMFWHQEDPRTERRLYESAEGHDLLVEHDMDVPTAAVGLLARDACALLEQERRSELASAWETVDDDLLADYLVNPSLRGWPKVGDSRLTGWTRVIRETLSRGR